MSRKTAREVAMKLTYEKMFGCDDTYHDVLEKSGIDENPTKADIAFVEDIVAGVQANIEQIDSKIQNASLEWSIDRMPRVDLSILRISAYEILYRKDIPVAVSINEAVDLAKLFSDERAPKFINGLLGKLARQAGEPGQAGE